MSKISLRNLLRPHTERHKARPQDSCVCRTLYGPTANWLIKILFANRSDLDIQQMAIICNVRSFVLQVTVGNTVRFVIASSQFPCLLERVCCTKRLRNKHDAKPAKGVLDSGMIISFLPRTTPYCLPFSSCI